MKDINQLRKIVIAVLAVSAILSSILGIVFSRDWAGWLINISTELIGLLITYGLLELVIARREASQQTKERLIMQLGSQIRDVAVSAAEEIRRNNWHSDGSLQGKRLAFANLEGVYFSEANLDRSDLSYANFQGAALDDSSFVGATLQNTNFQSAYIGGGDFQNADLRGANLTSTNIRPDDTKHMFNTKTILPDGTFWIEKEDMQRFVDVDHPNYWRYEEY